MNIFISGISGTGMGPLALMAKQAGFNVWGSDLARGAINDELIQAGIDTGIGEQDGRYLREIYEKEGIDWFVHTSALKDNHPELQYAKEEGVKCTKRDDFTAFLVKELGLKMVAVAGTHGKTTTTSMIIWAALKIGLPVSYIVGTTLGFASSGAYHKGDQFFIYEADEYDRNFLKYHPWLAILPAVSYDHPDIYPTREDYLRAFDQFEDQSQKVMKLDGPNIVGKGIMPPEFKAEDFSLSGAVRRLDAALAANAIREMTHEYGQDLVDNQEIINVINQFPGVGRRFERIANGVYTDYAHHPEEIAATIKIAQDEANQKGFKGVVVVYQPHQNTRQHKIRAGYKDSFVGADKVYWLPTYLTREDPNLPVLTPQELFSDLVNKDVASAAETSPELEQELKNDLKNGYMVVLMTAGPADQWLRDHFAD